MVLQQLQDLLAGIYDLPTDYRVYDFLFTERERLPSPVRESNTDEQVLVLDHGGAASVGLFLDPQLLERLKAANPLEALNGGNLADYWTALEGVSHFLYLIWNAGYDRGATLLELELPAGTVDCAVWSPAGAAALDTRRAGSIEDAGGIAPLLSPEPRMQGDAHSAPQLISVACPSSMPRPGVSDVSIRTACAGRSAWADPQLPGWTAPPRSGCSPTRRSCCQGSRRAYFVRPHPPATNRISSRPGSDRIDRDGVCSRREQHGASDDLSRYWPASAARARNSPKAVLPSEIFPSRARAHASSRPIQCTSISSAASWAVLPDSRSWARNKCTVSVKTPGELT